MKKSKVKTAAHSNENKFQAEEPQNEEVRLFQQNKELLSYLADLPDQDRFDLFWIMDRYFCFVCGRRKENILHSCKVTDSSVKELIRALYPSNEDFYGFLLDHFIGVYRELTNGMDRERRTKLLFEAASGKEICDKLYKAKPFSYKNYKNLLKFE